MSTQSPAPEEVRIPLDASMLNGLPDPVFLVDLKHVIVDCNRAAKQLLGTDALGSMLDELLNSPFIVDTIDATLSGTPGTRSEVSLPYPIQRDFELNVWRLPDLKSEGPAWAMVVLHDVTATKRAEQTRADFVANVSHELRSPLSSVLGFIETLRGPAKDDPEATDRFLEIMESEAQRMARLINDLLALSKVESDEHIRPEGMVDIGKLLIQVSDILSVGAKDRDIDIVVQNNTSNSLVLGDQDELTQVFQNLINNAISYGNKGVPVEIYVTDTAAVPPTNVPGVSVSIVNKGEGIPADSISRLTERFYRVDKGRSRSMGGTGLGLAIVKHIVARHRGHLDIQSTLGEDTTFTVSIPKENYPPSSSGQRLS
jgi:two-component system phosphate regulon sensor histidine kinase PhoR